MDPGPPSGMEAVRYSNKTYIEPKRAVLLMNLGTPSSTDVSAVRRYLVEFLSDPYVIRLPSYLGWLNPLLGRSIARFRAPHSARLYRSIWTQEGSPLMVLSKRQAAALRAALPDGWKVFLAMRYGEPSIGQVIEQMQRAGVTELVVIPMYPHYAGPTIGTALDNFYHCVQQAGLSADITVRTAWYDDAGYIRSQARIISDFIAERGLTAEETFLLFSAHSLPKSYIKRGDPYLRHIATTVVLVARQLSWPGGRKGVSFQSKLGPVPWLSPTTEQMLQRLAERGAKNVVVCPISFTVDCLETLEEIGISYGRQFADLGGQLHLCPAPNDHKTFVDALRHLALRGPQRLALSDRPKATFVRAVQAKARPTSLLMVGVSVPSRIGSGSGPSLTYEDAAVLRSVKLASRDTVAFLRGLCEGPVLEEAFVWNTCNRFELYGWTARADGLGRSEEVALHTLRRALGARAANGMAMNVLRNRDAVHHLLRTTAGLNSDLPGETDIAAQLLAALRVARAAGSAGDFTETLVARAIETECSLRSATAWDQFAPSSCSALLARLDASSAVDWRDRPITVIGRSHTALSMLRLLVESLEIPTERITFVHKGNRRDGQIKQMRRLVTNGRKIRVRAYDDPVVLRVVAESGLTIYGIDSAEPMLDGKRLEPLLVDRGFERLVVDFNTLGSTVNLEGLRGLQLWDETKVLAEVRAYAEDMCSSKRFWRVVDQVEERLRTRAGEIARGLQLGAVATGAALESAVVSAEV